MSQLGINILKLSKKISVLTLSLFVGAGAYAQSNTKNNDLKKITSNKINSAGTKLNIKYKCKSTDGDIDYFAEKKADQECWLLTLAEIKKLEFASAQVNIKDQLSPAKFVWTQDRFILGNEVVTTDPNPPQNFPLKLQTGTRITLEVPKQSDKAKDKLEKKMENISKNPINNSVAQNNLKDKTVETLKSNGKGMVLTQAKNDITTTKKNEINSKKEDIVSQTINVMNNKVITSKNISENKNLNLKDDMINEKIIQENSNQPKILAKVPLLEDMTPKAVKVNIKSTNHDTKEQVITNDITAENFLTGK